MVPKSRNLWTEAHRRGSWLPLAGAGGLTQWPGQMPALPMQVCEDTIIGDQLVRGVSGGQKKRVTTGGSFLLSCGVHSRDILPC